uniref:Uncharacterized protein n=1 Tax=Triticum urartu TaxID=4572 RepID=A0A8R7TND0_TRIUA
DDPLLHGFTIWSFRLPKALMPLKANNLVLNGHSVIVLQ